MARAVEAPSLVVTTTSDIVDDGDDQTSLREALAYAATLTGPQTITFSNSGAVNFFDGVARTITLVGTQLTITSDVTIIGPGANKLSVSGDNKSRILEVTSGATATLSGLTLTAGRMWTDSQLASGGGVLNAGTLNLSFCEITGCWAAVRLFSDNSWLAHAFGGGTG